jgi:hypothetical protein
MPNSASRTIAEILGSPLGARHLGDAYPRWPQGRGGKLSKTIEDAEHEADLLAKALRRDGSDEALDLAEVLDGCTPRRPCTSGACPICGTAAQRVFVDATRNVFRGPAGAWVAVNVVYGRAAVDCGALDGGVFDKLRRRLDRALGDCGVHAFGAFDISANRHEHEEFEPHWAPHALIFAPASRMRASADHLRRWFPPDERVPRPVKIQEFDGSARGRAYTFKPDFFERISLERRQLVGGSRSTYSTRLKPIWGDRRVEVALALDGVGLDERLYLCGFDLVSRNGDVEIVRSSQVLANSMDRLADDERLGIRSMRQSDRRRLANR